MPTAILFHRATKSDEFFGYYPGDIVGPIVPPAAEIVNVHEPVLDGHRHGTQTIIQIDAIFTITVNRILVDPSMLILELCINGFWTHFQYRHLNVQLRILKFIVKTLRQCDVKFKLRLQYINNSTYFVGKLPTYICFIYFIFTLRYRSR